MSLVVGAASAVHEEPAGAAPSLMVTDSAFDGAVTNRMGNLGQPELPHVTTSSWAAPERRTTSRAPNPGRPTVVTPFGRPR